jgi:hypothetical protein
LHYFVTAAGIMHVVLLLGISGAASSGAASQADNHL